MSCLAYGDGQHSWPLLLGLLSGQIGWALLHSCMGRPSNRLLPHEHLTARRVLKRLRPCTAVTKQLYLQHLQGHLHTSVNMRFARDN